MGRQCPPQPGAGMGRARVGGPRVLGTHAVLNWHLVLLEDGELLVYGRDLGLQVGHIVLQGLHELQTDPQFLQRLGRVADSAAWAKRVWAGGREGRAYPPPCVA